MSKRLTKGANTSLTGPRPDLRHLLVGIGWRSTSAAEWTIDITVLLCDDRNHVPSEAYVLPAETVPSGGPGQAVPVQGPDAEQFEVDLTSIPDYLQSVLFAASIAHAEQRRQTFGQLADIYLRLVDLADGTELARFDIEHDCAGETALALAEIYRHGTQWKVRAIGQGWADGLAGLRADYGAHG